ncbi:MAG: alanine--tRNA ligase [Anaerolineae bacterium]|jgi:alanyl-tRNA synthetase|nr:alanine--tRNA ligase [Anaerolineae bacterium]MBT7601787.1 alanine--tRNA ligase [Anaerolineae bacterium]MBT7992027.1 alanine--tRNA ligase [Anaerolineae bacterium]
MTQNFSGAQIRQDFIDFFNEHTHTFVPSASLVPGGDATLLFTNAGMVQFKDVFLGTDKRPYTRAVNSQKCMRVAGKHNDLEDVGRDDTHHTFFEMLGNWSFGDYYKKEAIEWAWQLLTEVWGLPKENLYATVFKDEKGEIPSDDEAAEYWKAQPGMTPERVFYLGRSENFWEMADTGPCGPCSEIHIDLRPEEGEVTEETLDTDRFIELWNLVFIQYNRLDANTLDPLPATHVDTGMGFERIVSVLQGVDSNYKIDLFEGALKAVREITGHSEEEMLADFTPYRVIADHARTAAFLIADGVVPGNMSRNYVCRMIIRRAARFGGKINLNEPFLAKVADAIVDSYGEFYPELEKNRATILDNLTREEIRFAKTVESGTAHLDELLAQVEKSGEKILAGNKAFDLYATFGLPFEITRDIAKERDLDVDEAGFVSAMDAHRIASGGGKAMGALGGEDAEMYANLVAELQKNGKLSEDGVAYDPYTKLEAKGEVLALIVDGLSVENANAGDAVEVAMPETGFYIEAGGQVGDEGVIVGDGWQINVTSMRKPAPGLILLVGEVQSGNPKVGDAASANVDEIRRKDIMRNHTATHLLHAALHEVLGDHARQAGSLVAPEKLRFDFTHPEGLTRDEIEKIERYVNERVLENHPLHTQVKSLQEAMDGGATALFGEKYGEVVRNVRMSGFSNELCGGTHCESSGEVGTFVITSEGSAAAGIRRIEAITGRAAYDLIQKRFSVLNQVAAMMTTTPEKMLEKAQASLGEMKEMRHTIQNLRQNLAAVDFTRVLDETSSVGDVEVLTAVLKEADVDMLRKMADTFRERNPQNAVAVLACVIDERPMLIASVTDDLVKRGIKAGDLVKFVATPLGGGGGGRPTLAQAGGKDASKLDEVLAGVVGWVEEKLK